MNDEPRSVPDLKKKTKKKNIKKVDTIGTFGQILFHFLDSHHVYIQLINIVILGLL